MPRSHVIDFLFANLSVTSATSREPPGWDQTGGTVMRASGAPDKVNTRSIEQFIFSPRDVCAPKKMIQARLPRSSDTDPRAAPS
jgi:hypothetical protein